MPSGAAEHVSVWRVTVFPTRPEITDRVVLSIVAPTCWCHIIMLFALTGCLCHGNTSGECACPNTCSFDGVLGTYATILTVSCDLFYILSFHLQTAMLPLI